MSFTHERGPCSSESLQKFCSHVSIKEKVIIPEEKLLFSLICVLDFLMNNHNSQKNLDFNRQIAADTPSAQDLQNIIP